MPRRHLFVAGKALTVGDPNLYSTYVVSSELNDQTSSPWNRSSLNFGLYDRTRCDTPSIGTAHVDPPSTRRLMKQLE